MTALVAVTLAGFGLIATLVVTMIVLVREVLKAKSRIEELHSLQAKLTSEKVELATTIATMTEHAQDLDEALKSKTAELSRDQDARKQVEKQRDELLADLAKTGDPRAVAQRIRDELRALSEASSTKASQDRQGPGALHGAPAKSTVR